MPVSPADAEDLAPAVVSVYAEAERLILARIARNLAAEQDTPDWVERKLLAAGLLQRYTAAVLTQATSEARRQTATVSAIAWNRGIAKAELDIAQTIEPELRARAAGTQRLRKLTEDAQAVLEPVHRQTLRSTDDAYRQVVSKVAAQVQLGNYTRRQATQAALDELATKGITGFRDARGRDWELSAYVEMATRTAVARAAVDGHLTKLQAAGYNLVMVSDAPQECVLCRPFEGRVFSISGAAYSERVEGVTVMMSLDAARARGLFHPGCRHSTALYQPGVTQRPSPAATADPVGDAARQRLRYLERRVRAARRREAAAMDPMARAKAQADIRAGQKRIRAHVATTPAKRQPHRERLVLTKPPGGHVLPPIPDPPKLVPPPAPPVPKHWTDSLPRKSATDRSSWNPSEPAPKGIQAQGPEAEARWREAMAARAGRAAAVSPQERASKEQLSDAIATNPRYHEGRDYQVNCTHTTAAWEMRQRGYDVQAAPRFGGKGRNYVDWLHLRWATAAGDKPQLEAGDNYRNPGFTKLQVLKQLKAQPDGARGILQVQWRRGGAHVLSWVRDDSHEDGVRFYDPQPGSGPGAARSSLEFGKRFQFIRMDTLVPLEALDEFLVYAGKKAPTE